MKFTRRGLLKTLGALFAAPVVANGMDDFVFNPSLPSPESVVGNSIKGVQGLCGQVLTADGWMQPESFATKPYVDSAMQGLTFESCKPLNPIIGSTYYDRNDCMMYVYTSSGWSMLGGTSYYEHSEHSVCQYCKTPTSGKHHCTSCGAPT